MATIRIPCPFCTEPIDLDDRTFISASSIRCAECGVSFDMAPDEKAAVLAQPKKAA